jgi:hypothetical protein
MASTLELAVIAPVDVIGDELAGQHARCYYHYYYDVADTKQGNIISRSATGQALTAAVQICCVLCPGLEPELDTGLWVMAP